MHIVQRLLTLLESHPSKAHRLEYSAMAKLAGLLVVFAKRPWLKEGPGPDFTRETKPRTMTAANETIWSRLTCEIS